MMHDGTIVDATIVEAPMVCALPRQQLYRGQTSPVKYFASSGSIEKIICNHPFDPVDIRRFFPGFVKLFYNSNDGKYRRK